MRPSLKDSAVGELSSANKGGSSDADVRLFVGFFEIYGVSTRTRGGERVESLRTFCGQGESIFRDFVRASFIVGPNEVLSSALKFSDISNLK